MIPAKSADATEPVYIREPVEMMRAIELPYGTKYHHGILPFDRSSPLDRGFYFGHGFHAVYLARAWPGKQYTLGFRYAADWRKRVKVMLFDRWPYAPGARHFDLPRGPVLRDRSDQVEMRWHFSISPDSSGTVLYIVVEALDDTAYAISDDYDGFPHDLFLAWPPIESRNEIGHGVNYLQGPKNLVLTEQRLRAPILRAGIESGRSGSSFLPPWAPPRDIMINGSFMQGMQHWTPIRNSNKSNQLAGEVVGRDGLILRGNEGQSSAGVWQQLETSVHSLDRLMLQARIKITRQSEPGIGKNGDHLPLSISVCYDDVKNQSHCGADAYISRFYSLKTDNGQLLRHAQRIPLGEWFWFRDDLMHLTPRPALIHSITITGSGRHVWQSKVREIHLIKHGGSYEHQKN